MEQQNPTFKLAIESIVVGSRIYDKCIFYLFDDFAIHYGFPPRLHSSSKWVSIEPDR